MPNPNGTPTLPELEQGARDALSSVEDTLATKATDPEAREIAHLELGRGLIFALLVIGERLEQVTDNIPTAGRGF